MLNIEQLKYKVAYEIIDMLSLADEKDKNVLKRIENRLSEAIQINESKGLYVLNLWLRNLSNKEKDKKFAELLLKNIKFSVPAIQKSGGKCSKDMTIEMFENKDFVSDIDLGILIYSKKVIEESLNYTLYRVRALANNLEGRG
ncbi:MAG: hypothetical protein KAX49_08250 [Halanaerobiales bacterium]|nr:hypothetical protein [Halanaerobiales bacterium]